jgi:hypothetical protein
MKLSDSFILIWKDASVIIDRKLGETSALAGTVVTKFATPYARKGTPEVQIAVRNFPQ